MQELVKLIYTESERLKQYVNTLTPDDLEHPTPCEDWNVGDILAHFVWGWPNEEHGGTYADIIERGRRGDTATPAGFPPPGSPLPGPAVDALYSQGALTQRQKLGGQLLPVFVQTCDSLDDLLRNIGPEDWDKPCYHTHGLRPAHSFLPTLVQEFAVHEWDIRTSLQEPSPMLSPASISFLMTKHAQNRNRPWRVPFPRPARAADPLRYRFDMTGPGADKQDMVVTGDTARMEPAAETPAHLEVRGDTGTFVLLLYGRLSLHEAITSGGIEAQGDLVLASKFDQ